MVLEVGYFPIDKKSKDILDKNYEIIRQTVMTKEDMRKLLQKLLNERDMNEIWLSEDEENAEEYQETIDFLNELLEDPDDLYELVNRPFTEFYSKLLTSHPKIASNYMAIIKPDGVNFGFKNKYVKIH
jgi:hypothetical protein